MNEDNLLTFLNNVNHWYVAKEKRFMPIPQAVTNEDEMVMFEVNSDSPEPQNGMWIGIHNVLDTMKLPGTLFAYCIEGTKVETHYYYGIILDKTISMKIDTARYILNQAREVLLGTFGANFTGSSLNELDRYEKRRLLTRAEQYQYGGIIEGVPGMVDLNRKSYGINKASKVMENDEYFVIKLARPLSLKEANFFDTNVQSVLTALHPLANRTVNCVSTDTNSKSLSLTGGHLNSITKIGTRTEIRREFRFFDGNEPFILGDSKQGWWINPKYASPGKQQVIEAKKEDNECQENEKQLPDKETNLESKKPEKEPKEVTVQEKEWDMNDRIYCDLVDTLPELAPQKQIPQRGYMGRQRNMGRRSNMGMPRNNNAVRNRKNRQINQRVADRANSNMCSSRNRQGGNSMINAQEVKQKKTVNVKSMGRFRPFGMRQFQPMMPRQRFDAVDDEEEENTKNNEAVNEAEEIAETINKNNTAPPNIITPGNTFTPDEAIAAKQAARASTFAADAFPLIDEDFLINNIERQVSLGKTKNNLQSISKNMSNTHTNTCTHTTTSVSNASDLNAKRWVKYADDLLCDRIDYGKAKGLYLFTTGIFADSRAVLIKLESALKYTYNSQTFNKLPMTLIEVRQHEENLRAIANFQFARYTFSGRMGSFSDEEIIARSSFSQYATRNFVFGGNWLSTRELSAVYAVPLMEDDSCS